MHIHVIYVNVQQFGGCGRAVHYTQGCPIVSMQLGMDLVCLLYRITSRLLFRGLHYIEAYGEIVEAFKIVRCIKGVFF